MSSVKRTLTYSKIDKNLNNKIKKKKETTPNRNQSGERKVEY